MMNWLWAIPWIVIIIFFAGWHFGGKVSVRKEIRDQMYELDNLENNCSRSISVIFKNLYELERKIEQLKEEK